MTEVKRPKKLTTVVYDLEICENGHITPKEGSKREMTLIKHKCGDYTYEDANFCSWCGSELNKKTD